MKIGDRIPVNISRFDGAMVSDPRDPRSNTAQVVSNFDVINNPYRMIPAKDTHSGDSSASTQKIHNFCIAKGDSLYAIYGAGQAGAGPYNKMFYKSLGTGGSNDLGDQSWTADDNATGATNLVTQDKIMFVYYQKTGFVYGIAGDQYVTKIDPDGSTAIAETERDLGAFTNTCQGLVHSKDDILYIARDNKIASNDNGSWSSTALTLPASLRITSLVEHGNYLAIACAPLNQVENSCVFLWDRDTSLSTLSESIDWGVGELKVLESLNGELVGVSILGPVGSLGKYNTFKDKIIFRKYNGVGVDQIEVFEGDVSSTASTILTLLGTAKQKLNNRLYFLMALTLRGTAREGLWSIGKNKAGEWSITLDKPVATALTGTVSNRALYGFIITGDYLLMSYLSGGTEYMDLTDSDELYAIKGVYESKIFNLGDTSLKKKLLGVTVTFDYLPTGSSTVILYYKKDADTAWTQIFSYTSTAAGSFVTGTQYTITTVGTTDFTLIGAASNALGVVFTATGAGSGTGKAVINPTSHSAVNIESTGASLPEYNEIQFKIESQYNANITGLEFTSEVTGKRVY